MNRLLSLASVLRQGQSASACNSLASAVQSGVSLEATSAGRFLGSFLGVHGRNLTTSSPASGSPTHHGDALVDEPPRKYRSLADKELWHEAWMYEDRFGSETDPVVVPSVEAERIIGVTDPDDDNLVVWGILKDAEPPRQFIEGGEFYVLKKVPYVKKVGDVMDELEAGKAALP